MNFLNVSYIISASAMLAAVSALAQSPPAQPRHMNVPTVTSLSAVAPDSRSGTATACRCLNRPVVPRSSPRRASPMKHPRKT